MDRLIFITQYDRIKRYDLAFGYVTMKTEAYYNDNMKKIQSSDNFPNRYIQNNQVNLSKFNDNRVKTTGYIKIIYE